MRQEDILNQIQQINREIETRQERINVLVKINREAVKRDPKFEEDYTESIESYYDNSL